MVTFSIDLEIKILISMMKQKTHAETTFCVLYIKIYKMNCMKGTSICIIIWFEEENF